MSRTWKENMWFAYSQHVNGIVRAALRGCAPMGSQVYYKVMEWCRQLVVDGAWYLKTGDDVEGRCAMARLDNLAQAGLPELATLCDMLATFIAAGEQRNRAQALCSGLALQQRYKLSRDVLRALMHTAAPPPPSNVIPLRRVD